MSMAFTLATVIKFSAIRRARATMSFGLPPHPRQIPGKNCTFQEATRSVFSAPALPLARHNESSCAMVVDASADSAFSSSMLTSSRSYTCVLRGIRSASLNVASSPRDARFVKINEIFTFQANRHLLKGIARSPLPHFSLLNALIVFCF